MRVPSSAPANPILRSHPQDAASDRGQRTDSNRICFFVHTDTDTSVVMPLDVHSVVTYQAG